MLEMGRFIKIFPSREYEEIAVRPCRVSSSMKRLGFGWALSCLLVLSLAYLSDLQGFGTALADGGIWDGSIEVLKGITPLMLLAQLAYLSIYCIFTRREGLYQHNRKWVIALLSFFAALAFVLVSAIDSGASLPALFHGLFGTLLSVLSLVVLSSVVFSILMPSMTILSQAKITASATTMKARGLLLLLLLFFMTWLPYLVIYSPGSPSLDLTFQLGQFKEGTLTTHHPLLSTLLYGEVFSFGENLFGANDADIGLFLLMLFQSLAMAVAFVLEIWALVKWKAPRGIIIGAILFFAFCPLFGIYCQWAVKDSVFMSAFVAFFVLYSGYANAPESFSRSPFCMIALGIAAIITALLRNNAAYVIILSLPFLCLFHTGLRYRIKKLLPLLLVILLIPVGNGVFEHATSASRGSIAEALSLPFQQTARYALLHGDEIDDWEKQAIDQILGFDDLAERYDPDISDPVKGGYRSGSSLGQYFRAWVSQGLKHPLAYISATAEGTYGFWSVSAHPRYLRGPLFYTDYDFGKTYGIDWRPWMPKDVRDAMSSFVSLLVEIPVINAMFQPGFYTWLLLLEIALLLLQKKGKDVIVFLPCLILLLTCIAGPVNGDIRYVLGIVAVAPLTLWIALRGGSSRVVNDGSGLMPESRNRRLLSIFE